METAFFVLCICALVALSANIGYLIGKEKGYDAAQKRYDEINKMLASEEKNLFEKGNAEDVKVDYNYSVGQPDVVEYLNSYYGKETR